MVDRDKRFILFKLHFLHFENCFYCFIYHKNRICFQHSLYKIQCASTRKHARRTYYSYISQYQINESNWVEQKHASATYLHINKYVHSYHKCNDEIDALAHTSSHIQCDRHFLLFYTRVHISMHGICRLLSMREQENIESNVRRV